jgi:membrane associated rhomboid family serine protease
MTSFGDDTRSRSIPYINVGIIALNLIVFLYEVSLSHQPHIGHTTELDRFIFDWGNIPACTFDAIGWNRNLIGTSASVCNTQPHAAWTMVSAMFIHGSWIHVLGNMLFLWIFGDNVEDALGHVRYAIFYFVVGVAGAITYGLVNPNSLTPAIGASGAIAGIMGAYIVLYPRALIYIFYVPIPALILVGLWFLSQLFSGFSSLGVDGVRAGSGVAYFAHIGGFIAGALLVSAFAMNRGRSAPKIDARWADR